MISSFGAITVFIHTLAVLMVAEPPHADPTLDTASSLSDALARARGKHKSPVHRCTFMCFSSVFTSPALLLHVLFMCQKGPELVRHVLFRRLNSPALLLHPLAHVLRPFRWEGAAMCAPALCRELGAWEVQKLPIPSCYGIQGLHSEVPKAMQHYPLQ